MLNNKNIKVDEATLDIITQMKYALKLGSNGNVIKMLLKNYGSARTLEE
jgi:hypothetical protein